MLNANAYLSMLAFVFALDFIKKKLKSFPPPLLEQRPVFGGLATFTAPHPVLQSAKLAPLVPPPPL